MRRVERSLVAFAGVAPSARALRKKNGMVRIGGALVHVDITTKIQGIAAFEGVWQRRVRGDLLGEKTAFMSTKDLLRTKRAANRAKDQGDIAFLETLTQSPKPRGG